MIIMEYHKREFLLNIIVRHLLHKFYHISFISNSNRKKESNTRKIYKGCVRHPGNYSLTVTEIETI